ncbi:MFS transporter [Nocardia sp. CA-128927]|uniref:MFS transporter n=1 Tax=Nocardia sp. CA-128927 TaxID=3239975 RepID=UPI003D967966
MTSVGEGKNGASDRVAVPLSRNRNYNILWSSQFFSEFAVEIALIAFPLLILAHNGTPLMVGLAASLLAALKMAAVVPAGLIADRWNRKKVMLFCQVGRAAAAGSVAVALALGNYALWHILLAIAVEGVLSSVFNPVEHAVLPRVVPEEQLSTALARNAARPFLAALVGPAIGGALFALHPAHPFLTNSVILGVSLGALIMLRLPPRRAYAAGDEATDAQSETDAPRSISQDLAAGFRWVLGHSVIRATLVWVMFINFVFNALIIIILATTQQAGLGADQAGLMMMCLGVGGVTGAICAPWLQARVPANLIIVGFPWALVVATVGMTLAPKGIPLGILLGMTALLAPAATTTVLTYQLIVTPDGLRGRLSSLVAFCTGAAAALGPAAGGMLVTLTGYGPLSMAICAATLAVVALGTLLSRPLRRFPTLRYPMTQHSTEGSADRILETS